MRPQLEALARELSLQNTTFVGRVPFEQMPALYDAADVYLMANDIDNMPASIIECLACGLPVVTTDVGGNAEVVAEAKLGLLVPFDDRDKLAEAIAKALERSWDRDFIVGYAEANSWDRRVNVLAGEFAKIVEQRAGSTSRSRPIHIG